MKINKSLGLNAILNIVKTVMGMIFPLITYPYITRVLEVSNLGKFNFSNSIVGYFMLIATFGISTYAVREGAKLRDNKIAFQDFVNEIFSINIVTMVISYIILFILLYISRALDDYVGIILIMSLSIIFTTFGTDWINTVHEDFFYITVRTVIFQILSILLLFVFVKDVNDIYKYTWISLFASAGSNLVNGIYCRKRYSSAKFKLNYNCCRHIKPLSLIFLSNITTTIFVNADQTMLGMMCGDFEVGLYALAVKIYSVAKTAFTALLIVVVPRISYMHTNSSENERNELCTQVANLLLIFVVPMSLGIYLLSDKIVLLMGGESFLGAYTSLKLLSGAVLCSLGASFMTYLLVIPNGKESILFISSLSSAVVNVLLNFFAIPLMQQNGAAITTIVSELLVFLIEFLYIKPKLIYSSIARNFIQIFIASLSIILVDYLVCSLNFGLFSSFVVIILFSVVTYFIILFLLKNQIVLKASRKIIKKT